MILKSQLIFPTLTEILSRKKKFFILAYWIDHNRTFSLAFNTVYEMSSLKLQIKCSPTIPKMKLF